MASDLVESFFIDCFLVIALERVSMSLVKAMAIIDVMTRKAKSCCLGQCI